MAVGPACSFSCPAPLKNQIPKGTPKNRPPKHTYPRFKNRMADVLYLTEPSSILRRRAHDDDVLPAFRRRCSFARAGLMRTGVVEPIKNRQDLLAIFGSKVKVSNGIDRR
jgi:hypothetical protein